MVQEVKKKYWFDEENLLKPIDWEYFNTLSKKVQNALELYMRGDISMGRAVEIARLPYRKFDLIRSKARIPVHH